MYANIERKQDINLTASRLGLPLELIRIKDISWSEYPSLRNTALAVRRLWGGQVANLSASGCRKRAMN